jgi:hypothetical protein
MSKAELRKSLQTAAAEIDRVCLYFDYLQQFVLIETSKPSCDPDDVIGLLTHSMQGVDLLFANAGADFTLENAGEGGFLADVDPMRFEEALTRIFTVLLRLVSRDDRVRIKVAPDERTINVVLERNTTEPSVLRAESRLTMALADANLRTQGVGLTWDLNPFTASIRFPESHSTH